MDKFKIINTETIEVFENEINKFISNTDIVITKFDIDLKNLRAYFFFLDKEQYLKIIENNKENNKKIES